MRIGVIDETHPAERRVGLTPDAVEAHVSAGRSVTVEAGAGVSAGHPDDAYIDAGATIAERSSVLTSDVVVCVQPPADDVIAAMVDGSWLVGMVDPVGRPQTMAALAQSGVTTFSLESLPRTTIAQAMDVLSSQATAAGYAAVLLAASTSPDFMPMLITAAGTIAPSKALVLGVGVAGLQAIAMLRRLGAAVYAYDIRPETQEQVESLGAKFVAAPTQSFDAGGYARAVDDSIRAQQQEALAAVVASSQIVITTAQVPGRKAPVLVTAEMVQSMAAGAVIVDMAASSGGNVEGSRPDESVDVAGVTILGPSDLASRAPASASKMFAKNVTNFIEHLTKTDELDFEDDIVAGTCITHAGEILDARVTEAMQTS